MESPGGLLFEAASVIAWPNRLTDVTSWHSHIPFAYWCIDALRPGVFVELGTHKGDSYCAFCEAVERLGLSTVCYAVDTWGGDHEAGFYGDEVFRDLQAYHDPHFAKFSRLVQATFDEALGHFPDGAIDLLHVDGLHTYEAVRHDFETWLPKLSASAVVLLHDINVREKDFGAWRYWQELILRYPHFTFHHGHGLGVLVVGAAAPEPARHLAASDCPEAEQVRSFFARLGSGILNGSRLQVSEARVEGLRGELEQNRARANGFQQRVASVEGELAARRASEDLLRNELERLQREAAARHILPRVLGIARRFSGAFSPRLRRETRIISRSRMFNEAWYLEKNPDVAAAKLDPVRHYLRFGAAEGRNPHPLFDTRAYLERNPDVAESGVNPLVHSILHGTAMRTAAGDVALPLHGQPLVSIVIPVHGKSDYTERCLASIASCLTRVPYEVIVVDDASRDATATMLAKVRNLRVLTNTANLGYLRSCNAGAALAKGRYIVLLNNDTEVGPEWLDALVDLAAADPDVGVVGAMLVYPDGTLQEAGAIIWADGTGWNYGRNGDMDRSEFNFVREVDYCSGACLLVRADLLRQLGGYDERFAPAYYEDADLCFAARSAGYRVLYQPRARIVHHEGVSHGTDPASGIKNFQEVNRRMFCEKWAVELAHQSASGPEKVRSARDRRPGPGILVIDHTVPTPDRDSGSLRMSLLLRALVEFGCRVRFLPQNLARMEPYSTRLGQLGVEVLYSPDDVRELLHGLAGDVELTIISRPTVAIHFMPLVRELMPGSKVVYDMVDFHGLRESRRSEICADAGMKGAASYYQELELALIRAADASVAVTEYERDLVLAGAPGACVHVVPNIHESPRSKAGFAERDGLLFVGSYQHAPNEDAVLYFHSRILPLIRRRLPEVVLHLVGHPVLPSIQALASLLVRVHGWVEDLSELHERCRVFVAPLRFGAGMKGKIGDSMVRGVPVVTTSVGAEGMHLTDGEDVLVADDPVSFADAVVRLYTDEAVWKSLADRGARHIAASYSPPAAAGRIAALLEELGLSGRLRDCGQPRLMCHRAFAASKIICSSPR